MVGVIGLTIMLVAGYSEWTSIDLSRHSLRDYLNRQFGMRVWWDVVGIPLLAGAAYIGLAAFGPGLERRTGKRVPVFLGCLLLALALALGIGGIGYYATITTGILVLAVVASERKAKRWPTVDTATCEKCGNIFTPLPPQSAGHALISERRVFDVAPELREAEEVTCSKCGHKQRTNAYLFFGFLKAQGVRIVLGVILVGMLLFAIWWGGLLRR
jgi:hypothetical protein